MLSKSIGTTIEPTIVKVKEEEPKIVETVVPAQELEKSEEIKKEQADHSRCFDCKKKVGALGNKCKCGFTYCKSHRLPEDHECTYDFKQEGAKKLAKENPAIIASKISKI